MPLFYTSNVRISDQIEASDHPNSHLDPHAKHPMKKYNFFQPSSIVGGDSQCALALLMYSAQIESMHLRFCLGNTSKGLKKKLNA